MKYNQKQAEWRVREEELVGAVINMESKYAKLEKELNLESMNNEYSKTTHRQYRKRAKQIRYTAFVSCERDTELFCKYNRKVEVGLIFNGNIESESGKSIEESSSSSID